MRTRLLIGLIVLILSSGNHRARAQEEPGKIIDQYVKAAGGKALSRIQTLSIEGTFTSDDGKTGTYTLDTKLPNRYYSELLVGDRNLIEAYNGKSAWHQNAAGELGTLVGPEGMQLEAAAQYYNSRLLNLKALFKENDDNQKANDKLKENYAGSQSEEETEFEGDGRMKKHDINEYTFFYLNGDEITTLVKKDGKPLNDTEQKRENEKTQKRIEEHQKRATKKEAKEEKAKEEGKSEEKDEPGIEIFLRACQFVNPRRERFRGQDVLVFDFEPNPEFKPHKLVEKVVQKLAGVVWIDEKARDVARLEAYFTGDMKIGGGLLANLQKGTSFVFEQSFVNNEVWLPTYMEAHVGVRFLLVKGIKASIVTRYWDYRKFNVETLSTISKPKGASDAPADPPTKPE